MNAAADLQASLSSQVHVEEELLLQLQGLVFGVRTTLLPATLCSQPVCPVVTFGFSCWKRDKVSPQQLNLLSFTN